MFKRKCIQVPKGFAVILTFQSEMSVSLKTEANDVEHS